MKIRVLSCILGVFAVLMTIIGVSCLSKAYLSDEILPEIDAAYLEYAKEEDDTIVLAESKSFVGKYHGNVVVTAFRHSIEWVVPAVVIEYYVDDIFICKLGDATHEIIVYTKDKKIKLLKDAYHDGTISKLDLLSIKWGLIEYWN